MDDDDKADGKDGKSQVVERTCAILRSLGNHGQRGARLIDVTRATGLSRPSAHRILATLVAEGFVRRAADRRYQLGPILHELGMSAPSPVGNPESLRPLIQRLADECGDTVYLAMRRGDYAHYLLRCEGAYPIRTHVVGANQSLPLVSGHSGRALLAALPEEEAEAIIARAEAQDPTLFLMASADILRDEIEQARRKGYGWSQDVTFIGVAGLTMAVENPGGIPFLAVTISSVSPRLSFARANELLPLLTRTAQAVQKRVAQAD